MHINLADWLYSSFLKKLLDFMLPKFGTTVTFVVIIITGFLFYSLFFYNYILFLYKKRNNLQNSKVSFWSKLKQEVGWKDIILFALAIFLVYFFYRMMLNSVYDYPDIAIITKLVGLFGESDLAVVSLTLLSIGLLICLYIIGKLKSRK